MLEAWLNFIIVILAQLLLLIICAYHEKKISEISHLLGWSALIAITIGIPFDLVAGKFLGIHSFILGFDMSFLIINAILSYGLFTINILLLQNVSLLRFIFWNIAIIAVYEITNNFFPVWKWGFSLPAIRFMIILLVGYLVGAIVIAIISHIFLKRQFFFIDNLLRK